MPEYDRPESESRIKSQRLDEAADIGNMYRMETPMEEGRMTNLVIEKPIINTAAISSPPISPTSDQKRNEQHQDFESVLLSPTVGYGRTSAKSSQQGQSLHQNENRDSASYSEPSMEALASSGSPPSTVPIGIPQQGPRLHGSSSESASSSAVVTPQQHHSERFGSIGEINRSSVDSTVDVEATDFKIARSFIAKQPLSQTRPTSVVLVDEVCPLDIGVSTPVSTYLPPAAPKEQTQSGNPETDNTSISPTQKSRLSLLPSAFGFAASLLPLSKTESASSVDSASSTDRSSSSAGTLETSPTSPTTSVRHRRQSSDSSETSSIVSTSSSKGIVDSIPALGTLGPSSWRSLTTFLTSRGSVAPIQESPTTPKPGKNQRPAARNTLHIGEETPSTSFLLHHVTSASATADRRRSLELGGPQMLREGFERVKAEMVSAAKELREKESLKRDSARSDATLATTKEEDMNEAERSTSADLASKGGGKPDKHALSADGIDWPFWGAVMSDYELVARTRPKELSKAIQEGVPAVVRGTIWQLMSASKSITLEATYSALLKLPSPHEKAIQKDLSRTFPNHAYFKKGNGVGQENLFNVVKAYSLYDQDVGYTQGLAFIVAALLLNMPDEEAFCVLVRLMQSYGLRSHFIADMPGLQLRMYQFDRLLEELLPVLHLHFVRAGVKSSMYASQWFMTMFSYRFPLSLVYRIFDIVFAEGVEAIFRFSMALMRKNEAELLRLDFEGILRFLTVDIFECYKNTASEADCDADSATESRPGTEWLTNDFVRDAYAVQFTPFMLDSFAGEWEEHLRAQNAHALELDTLRNANRSLRDQVKQMENAFSTMNNEHVEIVKQLVQSRIEKEELEAELIRYKVMCADLAHEQQNSMSRQNRMASIASFQSNR